MAATFRFLEHIAIADVAFEASGETPSELFTAAAQAVIETMVNSSSVSSSWSLNIEREEEDVSSLLFEWLSDIVYVKDAEGVVFQKTTATVLEDPMRHVWRLQGTLSGEYIDSKRHELRSDVKAVTKHLYEVLEQDNRWTARVVLDI
ncbi:MAG: archease [Nitrospiraceae bacterium]|nr:archease [Nitrospiraceae bacterium]